MPILLTAMFCIIIWPAWTQESVLQGVVSVFNSKYDSGKTEYLANASVEEVLGRSQATLTLSDGSFRLHLVDVRPMSSFQFIVAKENYEVVNTGQLTAIAGQLAPVRIYMAPRGKIVENKRRFYKIGKTVSERALDNKIAEKRIELQTLRSERRSNSLKVMELERQIADLQKLQKNIDQHALELAERFAHINLDDASVLHQRAFRQFQNGNIDSALIILSEVDWSARVDSILVEEARLLRLQQRIHFNDSIIALQRDSLAAALRLKSASEVGLQQYREALRSEELMLTLYEHETDLLLPIYVRVAWLSLLAQDFAAAKLYADRALAERYSVFARYFLGDRQVESEVSSWKTQPAMRDAARIELDEMRRAGLPETLLERLFDLLQ